MRCEALTSYHHADADTVKLGKSIGIRGISNRGLFELCSHMYMLQVYYPVRHHLVQHMISAMQRLGFTPSVTIEQRKLAVDLAEVVIKWELQRIKDQQVRSRAAGKHTLCLCSIKHFVLNNFAFAAH